LIYCILLNPAIDVIYTIEDLELGTTRTDVEAEVIPAGKGINVAKAARELGEKVCVAALMPEDDRVRFERYLGGLGIECRFFPVEGSTRISSTIIDTKKGPQVTHMSSAGRKLSRRLQDEFLGFLSCHMHKGDIWAIAGSIPRGFDPEIYKKIIAMCRAKDIATLLDTRAKALKMGVRALPTMIKPNLSELEGFFGEQIQGVRHIALKGKYLMDMGVAYVFVSLGADGMIAIHENECLLCSAPEVETVDTVGCGDALDAGLCAGYSRKFSFQEMCRLAVASGTSNALHRGAGVVKREEVWRLMEDVRVEAV